MALNVLMHPRNPFKTLRPDFKALAAKYELFRKHSTTDERGRVHIDFKSPECLRALTWSLLKDGYDLDVDIPLDRLIPTVPLRLNYLLWIEDILGGKGNASGIDIGCGAACIYSLLGARKNGWRFTATETDATNFEYATRNIAMNNITDLISVVKVAEESSLSDALRDRPAAETHDFVMCNPPFYGTNLEAWGMVGARTDHRPEPHSVSTASPVECIAPGGEVQFVTQTIIDSSLELRNRIRVYSTMLGKKASLIRLKEVLRQNGINNVGTTEFCQGRTMRWGLAWSFDQTISFPKSVSKLVKGQKPKIPLTYELAEKYDGHSMNTVATLLEGYFADLKASHTSDIETIGEKRWTVTCPSKSWSKQRQRKRCSLRSTDPSSSVATTTTEEHCDTKRKHCDVDGVCKINVSEEIVTASGSEPEDQDHIQDRKRFRIEVLETENTDNNGVAAAHDYGSSVGVDSGMNRCVNTSTGKEGHMCGFISADGEGTRLTPAEVAHCECTRLTSDGEADGKGIQSAPVGGADDENTRLNLPGRADVEGTDVEGTRLPPAAGADDIGAQLTPPGGDDGKGTRLTPIGGGENDGTAASSVCTFTVTLKRVKQSLVLELQEQHELTSREHLHQLLQYFKNKLTT